MKITFYFSFWHLEYSPPLSYRYSSHQLYLLSSLLNRLPIETPGGITVRCLIIVCVCVCVNHSVVTGGECKQTTKINHLPCLDMSKALNSCVKCKKTVKTAKIECKQCHKIYHKSCAGEYDKITGCFTSCTIKVRSLSQSKSETQSSSQPKTRSRKISTSFRTSVSLNDSNMDKNKESVSINESGSSNDTDSVINSNGQNDNSVTNVIKSLFKEFEDKAVAREEKMKNELISSFNSKYKMYVNATEKRINDVAGSLDTRIVNNTTSINNTLARVFTIEENFDSLFKTVEQQKNAVNINNNPTNSAVKDMETEVSERFSRLCNVILRCS